MGAVFAYVNLNQSSQLIAEEQINSLGNWSAATTYGFPDVVFYSDSLWIALAANQNSAPPDTQEVSQTGNWSALTIVDGQYDPRSPEVIFVIGSLTPFPQIGDSGTLVVDFFNEAVQRWTIEGDTHVSASNITEGAEVSAILIGDGQTRTLTYDGFTWFDSTPPGTTTPYKATIIDLLATGTTTASVYATPRLQVS